jgi:hypothetical protein
MSMQVERPLQPADPKPRFVNVVLRDPSTWSIASVLLISASQLFKRELTPNAQLSLNVLAMLCLFGSLWLPSKAKRGMQSPEARAYQRGSFMGILLGMGGALLTAAMFQQLPHYAGALGIALFAISSAGNSWYQRQLRGSAENGDSKGGG